MSPRGKGLPQGLNKLKVKDEQKGRPDIPNKIYL